MKYFHYTQKYLLPFLSPQGYDPKGSASSLHIGNNRSSFATTHATHLLLCGSVVIILVPLLVPATQPVVATLVLSLVKGLALTCLDHIKTTATLAQLPEPTNQFRTADAERSGREDLLLRLHVSHDTDGDPEQTRPTRQERTPAANAVPQEEEEEEDFVTSGHWKGKKN